MSDDLRARIEERYSRAAREAAAGKESCCGGGCGPEGPDPVTRDLYDEETKSSLPGGTVLSSLGCGNPTALADLHPGETVLDLGAGGGIDVLLSARRVGPDGKAYGLDMSREMLELARRNAREAGASNVEFLEGHIEEIPLPDASVDVLLSNCVINLSVDKPAVFGEAFRVLRPGGRLAISDVVSRGPVPEEARRSMELWLGCVAGALEADAYARLLEAAGFVDVSIEVTRTYDGEDARTWLEEAGHDAHVASAVTGRYGAAFVRGKKPERVPASSA